MKTVRYGLTLLIFFGLVLGASALGWAQGQPTTFSAMGDVPYGSSEYAVLQQQMVDHNKYSPSKFQVHVGDIKSGSGSCTQTIYSDVANILKASVAPFYIIPGDNETTDCSNPSQALSWWYQYFTNFEQNFCGTPLTEHQSGTPENFAFMLDGVLYIGINLVGGGGASTSIQQIDAAWVDQHFTTKKSQVRAAVVFSQAGPNSSRNTFFNAFVSSAGTFGKPVLFLHGDGHKWIQDNPWSLSNTLRIEVAQGGSEDPVEITVSMNTSTPATAFLIKRNPWTSKTIVNMPPCANAGPDQTIASTSANLSGSAVDDGDPSSGSLTKTWSKVSGPGSVTFGNANSLTTTASFSSPGVYVLRLTANDSQLQGSDDVQITVQGAASPVLTIDDVILNEGNSGTTNAIFTVSLASGNGSTVTVDFQTNDGTTTSGDDYTANSGTLIFSGSTTSQTITVAINGDVIDEGQDETFFVNLSNPANATISDNQGQGTIVNDDVLAPPAAPTNLLAKTTNTSTIDLTWSDQSNNEDGFKIERKTGSGAFTEIAMVGTNANSYNDNGLNASTVYSYQVRAYTASTSSAYSNSSATETGSGIVASPGTNIALNKPGSASTTNSSYPTTNAFDGNISSTYWRSNSVVSGVAEWLRVDLGIVQTVGRAVIRWNGSYFAKSYQLQVSNNDVDWTTVYNTTSGVAGNADFSFTPALARYVRVYMTLNNGSTYRIYEFEVYSGPAPPPMPTLAINDVSLNEGNTGTTNAVFTVTLTGASVGTATVNYQTAAGTATEGDDYTANSGTLTFSGSTTSQTITVAINGDVNDEGQNETFFVNLSSATNATISDAQGQGTIVNDDMPVPPAAPTNLKAKTTGTSTVDLTWSDQSNNEDGFKIERKTGSGNFAEIASVGADAILYNDNGLNASTVYTYQVRAFKSSANSGYSNTSATETGSGIVANPGTNIALNKPGSASTTNSSYPTANAFDGNISSTYWRSNSVVSGVAEWLRVDLGVVQTVGRAVIRWNGSYFAKSYQLQVSNNDVDWTTVYSTTGGVAGNADFSFTPTLARYVRAYMTLNNGSTYRIYEFEVYSGPTPPPGQTFAMTVNINGSGSVSLSPSGGTYNAGTVVTLTPQGGAGFQFNGWSGDLTGSANPATITMDANKNVTATFTALPPTQYSLAVNTSGSGSVSLNPAGGTYDAGTVVTLTANPATGFQFSGWSGDLTGSTNPATITMNANKNVTATFTASGGSGQVVFEETKTGGSSSSTTVATSANLTGVSGHLYLAAIAKKSNVAVSSVSGLGLSWTQVKAQCTGRNQTGVEVWKAQGMPSGNGTVTATLAAVPSNAVIAVSRYSGVDAANPIGNMISGNTTGVNGACSGGTDNASYSFNLTTTINGAVIYGAAAMRNHTHTPGAGYTERAEIIQGSSTGSQASVAVQDKNVASAGTAVVDGTFDSSVDWAVVALEIKPQITLSKNSRVVDNATPASPAAFQLAQNDPNPFNGSTTIGFSVPVACNVMLEVYDATDQLVRTLVAGEMDPGDYSTSWNGDDEFNHAVAAGAYSYKMTVEDEDGNFLFTATRRMTLQPAVFQLDPSYPNPFNASTQIRFNLPQISHVTIKVYTLNGAEVKTLSDQEYTAGLHTLTFHAQNLPSGTYFYVMQAGAVRQVRRLMLVK